MQGLIDALLSLHGAPARALQGAVQSKDDWWEQQRRNRAIDAMNQPKPEADPRLAEMRSGLQSDEPGDVRGNIVPRLNKADGSWEIAAPQMLRDAGVGLLDLLAGTRTGEVTPEATGLLFDIAGGGAASAPLRGAGVGIFGGKLAKTADTGALKRAEQMAGEGVDRGDIWRDTGWFQGADGKWRFEIDDSQSIMGEKAMQELQGSGNHGATQRTIAGTLHHKDLYEAYPSLRNTTADVRYNVDLKHNSGEYRPDAGDNGGRARINVSTNATDGSQGPRSILLHELSHGVDDIEGFARGGSPADVLNMPEARDAAARTLGSRKADAESVIKTVQSNAERWAVAENDRAGGDGYLHTMDDAVTSYLNQAAPKELRDQYSNALSMIDRVNRPDAIKSMAPYMYERLAGEVEARNVQTRRDMSKDERRARPPWETQDVPDEQQIVRFGSGPSLMASIAKDTANQAGRADALPVDEASRMARAREMGFHDRDLYHGTSRNIDQFSLDQAGTGANAGLPEGAVFLTDRPEVADSYLGGAYVNRATTPPDASADMGGGVGRHYMEGSQVMPLRVRGIEDFDVWDYHGGGYTPDDMKQAISEAKKAGAPGVIMSGVRDPGIMDAAGPVGNPRKPGNTVVVFDPSSIRSRFAGFDPAKRDSADLLAAHVGTGLGPLGLLQSMQDEPRSRKQDRLR